MEILSTEMFPSTQNPSPFRLPSSLWHLLSRKGTIGEHTAPANNLPFQGRVTVRWPRIKHPAGIPLLERGLSSTQGGHSLWHVRQHPADKHSPHLHVETHLHTHRGTSSHRHMLCEHTLTQILRDTNGRACKHAHTYRHAHPQTNAQSHMHTRAHGPQYAPEASHSASRCAHTHRHVCSGAQGMHMFPPSRRLTQDRSN